MAWIETVSSSFRARHESGQEEQAQRLLRSLELTRRRLSEFFPRIPEQFTVVLHRSSASLSMAWPLLPLQRMLAAPSARRYVAGWTRGDELHVLTEKALAERAAGIRGSREMLAMTGPSLYARSVVVASNSDLPPRFSPARLTAELHWAWLLEGAARWFSGQTRLAGHAIARRLRESEPPAFPPTVRDAVVLGGTLIDLLAREQGVRTAAEFACRLHPQGSRAALSRVFDGRPFVHSEDAWRSHLVRLAEEH